MKKNLYSNLIDIAFGENDFIEGKRDLNIFFAKDNDVLVDNGKYYIFYKDRWYEAEENYKSNYFATTDNKSFSKREMYA
ncbi:hypothetical protein [Neobacillus soli]|uniref:hypothetical protein n=1 Tax=Neobacillus soli TaxID=220688 RepID=UPI0008242853|nr:hypothetical protein [Neobacillus soli]